MLYFYVPRYSICYHQGGRGNRWISGSKAGIQAGDQITAVNQKPVEDWNELVEEVSKFPGESVNLSIVRDGQELQVNVATQKDETGQYKIGIKPSETDTVIKKLNPVSADTGWAVYSTIILAHTLIYWTNVYPTGSGGFGRACKDCW
ncbi:hypothetical protein N752_02580 [Desulforamulus aquiferis]|nr:hypothetical protein N752_02580 [Desulforamulus aquiferis]